MANESQININDKLLQLRNINYQKYKLDFKLEFRKSRKKHF
jgi:hypothetical protein